MVNGSSSRPGSTESTIPATKVISTASPAPRGVAKLSPSYDGRNSYTSQRT